MNIYNVVITDYTGSRADLRFFETDEWLKRAEVFYHTFLMNGLWKIRLVFAAADGSLQFLYTHINQHFPSQEKANLFAKIYVRTAQKNTDKQARKSINHQLHFN